MHHSFHSREVLLFPSTSVHLTARLPACVPRSAKKPQWRPPLATVRAGKWGQDTARSHTYTPSPHRAVRPETRKAKKQRRSFQTDTHRIHISSLPVCLSACLPGYLCLYRTVRAGDLPPPDPCVRTPHSIQSTMPSSVQVKIVTHTHAHTRTRTHRNTIDMHTQEKIH